MVTTLDGEHPGEALEAAAPNETIVATGEHAIEEPLAVTTPGVTLRGLDLSLAGGADANLIEVAADGVTLEGFRLDGNRANQPGERQSSGIVVAGAANVTIRGGHIRRTSRHGVLVLDAEEVTAGGTIEGDIVEASVEGSTTDVTVWDVRVEEPRRDGCSVEGPGVSNVSVGNVRTFDSGDRGSVEIKDGTSDALVTDCYAEGCRYGVTVQDHGGFGVSNVRFLGNTAVDCDTAVDAQNSKRHENVVVAGNTGRDLRGDGMGGPGGIHADRIDGLVVANNLLDGVDAAGVTVRRCADATVTGNVVRSVEGPCIDAWDSTGVGITDNATDGVVRCRGGEDELRALRIADNRCPGGIVLAGAIERYLVSGNLGGVEDDADGAGLVTDNLA